MLVFRTKGEFDLRAVTHFGVNAKPGSDSPIGYFGTGLKYAIAVLLRTGHTITLHAGAQRHEFGLKAGDFRGKKFDFITMTTHEEGKPSAEQELPYSTEYGKDWHVWMAVRELISNTCDENGVHELWAGDLAREPDEVTFVVDGADAENAYLNEGILLTGGEIVAQSGYATVYSQPSRYVYCRGYRILDLGAKAEFTYNVSKEVVRLTEDRTCANENTVRAYMVKTVLDQTNPALVRRLLTSKRWEADAQIGLAEYSLSEMASALIDQIPAGQLIQWARNIANERLARRQRARASANEVRLVTDLGTWSKIKQLILAHQPHLADNVVVTSDSTENF